MRIRRGETFSVDILAEIEAEEDAVCLRCGIDTGLVDSEERHCELTVHRGGDRFRCALLAVQGEVHSHGRDRADSGDSASEEELPPGRPGAAGAGALKGRRHQ
jgi:hypothetical protein